MSDATNYLEGEWAKTIRGGGNGTDFTAPANLYVKLHTGAPGEDATANASAETTRKEITFGAPSNGTLTSTNQQEWASWSAGAETISHISIWDHATAGNPLVVAALTASKAVANGDTLRLATGAVTVTVA